MSKFKILFRYLFLISLPFVLYTLSTHDLFEVPTVQNKLYLLFALIFCIIAFTLSALSWKQALFSHNIMITKKQSIISSGLAIFGKYIPGKVWSIAGRAYYVKEMKNIPIKAVSLVSLKTQLVDFYVAATIGIVGLFFTNFGWSIKIAALISWFIGTLVLFNFGQISFKLNFTPFAKLLSYLAKVIDLKIFGFVHLKYFFAAWLSWSFGLSMLVFSVFPESKNWSLGFAFPVSTIIGMLAIFAPAGIGIRESIMVSSLCLLGMDTKDSISISVIARLWYMFGEFYIYIAAMVLKRIDFDTNKK